MDKKAPFSAADLEEFRKNIIDKITKAKEELVEVEKSLGGITRNIARDSIKKLEDVCEVEEQERLNTLGIRLKKFLRCLEEALGRLDNGTYGFCQVTGERIDKQRLLLVPHTTHSVEGKTGHRF